MNANRPLTELLPPPCFAKADIVRRFLSWAQSAGAEARAEGASALARAYLYSDLAAPVRTEAVLAMTALLDDPSVLVRRALAEALCHSSEAPRALILALAADEPEVAAAVLRRSPVLTEADLVDCAASGEVVAQTALARRPNLPPGTTVALVESGQLDAVLALIGNPTIDLPAEALSRIFARFRDDASVREALLERPVLPQSLRARIAVAAAKDLAVEASRWMPRERAERIAGEARDQAICSIFSSCQADERTELMRAMRAAGGAHAGSAAAFAARRRTGPVRRGFGGAVRLAAVARCGLHPRAAGGRLRCARPQGWLEERDFARLPRRARRHQGSCRRGWRRPKTVAGAKGHRRMRAARQSRALQGSGAALALRRRGGEGGSRKLRTRGGCVRFSRPAPANSGLFPRQR
jgi:hypothetical protein